MILKMLFLKLSNAGMSFGKEIFIWRSHINNEILSTSKQVQIIDKKNFVIATLNANSKMVIVYIAIQEQEKIPMHSEKQA